MKTTHKEFAAKVAGVIERIQELPVKNGDPTHVKEIMGDNWDLFLERAALIEEGLKAIAQGQHGPTYAKTLLKLVSPFHYVTRDR